MSSTTTTAPPLPTEHYAALTALHNHYRTLITNERSSMSLERQLWDSERCLYLSRIRELETTANAASQPPPPPPPPAPPSQPPSSQAQTQENSRPSRPALALDTEDEEEITPQEMAQLLREATRIVYPISHSRPRGQSLAEPAQGGVGVAGSLQDGDDDEEPEKGKEEVVELKLKKTSNFGLEFGRWR
ncbi:hypothetical protein BDD12DRAFT_884153 [Trichophaea hybrida]|nr:hypothetical protein BDD12DRAFT_884153 [Trichophaea hybrida]